MHKPIFLQGSSSTIVISIKQQLACIVYWGPKLSDSSSLDMLQLLSMRQEVPASPQQEVPLSLSPLSGQGFTGHPSISLSGSKDQWALAPELTDIEQKNPYQVTLISQDESRGIQVKQQLQMYGDSDIVKVSTEILNIGEQEICLDWCAAATIPIADHMDKRLAFEGHWAMEFQTQQSEHFIGSYVRENRRGRTSHDAFPGLIMHTSSTTEQSGECYGFHLGWSGNHKIVSEKMADGRAYLQMGELLLPNEITLQHGESYQSPSLYMTYANDGFSSLSRQFHRFVRTHLIKPQVKEKPRPVHYNTWEGIYFDHNMPTLLDLVQRAAAVGAERFVLDDGWFPGRHDDTAGLGDWFVDKTKYPDGLAPLIEAVTSKGMEFGLWVEPEMVNPDSDLFRSHPDWVLSCGENKQVGFRNQLVLDLTNPDVFDYLFERINALLQEYDISYLKWDMNRDINHPGDKTGQPGIHLQTKAFYALVQKLKESHPNIEIESCASGGGRADYGVLEHTDRIWTSDSNDALDRLQIQKGFSYFLPAELMGSHVGPRDCHITHRNLSMNLRASVALFGHMGMEMDLRELTEEEHQKLSTMVALYKTHRSLTHSGDLYRLESPEYAHNFGIVSEDKQEALFSYNVIKGHSTSMPSCMRFDGLSRGTVYKLEIIWPLKTAEKWPEESIFGFDTCLPHIDGQTFTGELLMQMGIQMPRLVLNSNLTMHLTALRSAP